MIIDETMLYRIQLIQRTSPELWNFFDGIDRYKDDAQNDLNCRRWQDTLLVAYFISTGEPVEIKSKPGEMTLRDSDSYTDRHGDTGIDFTLHRATVISEDRYLALRESYNSLSDEYKESLCFSFTNIFYLASYAKVLEDDFFILPPIDRSFYRRQIAVVGRVKGVEGYYLFEFFEG